MFFLSFPEISMKNENTFISEIKKEKSTDYVSFGYSRILK